LAAAEFEYLFVIVVEKHRA